MSDTAPAQPQDDHVLLGTLTRPYGVKGWLWVYSYTSPMDGILDYEAWVLRHEARLRRVPVRQGRRHGKGLVVRLEGVDSREAAESLAGAEILMPKAELPALADDEYYWHQLEGLSVVTREDVALGRIDHLFETGANDVMVVTGPAGDGVEPRERLLPFLPGEVVLEVDLDAGVMRVDWDPEF